MHGHRETELNIVVAGRASYALGDRRYELGADDLVWLFPAQEHQLIDRSEDFELSEAGESEKVSWREAAEGECRRYHLDRDEIVSTLEGSDPVFKKGVPSAFLGNGRRVCGVRHICLAPKRSSAATNQYRYALVDSLARGGYCYLADMRDLALEADAVFVDRVGLLRKRKVEWP